MEALHRVRTFSLRVPDMLGEMTVSLIVDDETADRLEEAFYEAYAGEAFASRSYPAPGDGPANLRRWCLCVAPEVGRQIRRRGWSTELIFVVTQDEFERRRPLLGPRDALLFHDVPATRLRVAVRLAIAGMTLFPAKLVPRGEMAGPVLEAFEQLSEADRTVMAKLALGLRNQEIADLLGRSAKCVRQSIERIFRNLGGLNRMDVAVLVYGRLSPFLDLRAAQPEPTWPDLDQM